MSSTVFGELIHRSRRISRDHFAASFGGVADEVIDMLTGPAARRVLADARHYMEVAPPLPNGVPRLQEVEFGRFAGAPALGEGLVAAVDGSPALPMQLYSAGQALCVGVGSLSHRRPLRDSLHFWSSQALLAEARSSDDFLAREERNIFGISQTAYLRYFEVRHGLEIAEPFLLFDGPLVYEWLLATDEGIDLYAELLASGKRALGVMKSLKANAVFAKFARVIRPGEVFVVETLADHLDQSRASNHNRGEGGPRYARPGFVREVAPHILRGVFRPAAKAFGFEVHADHFAEMLPILAADCQLNLPGHEIPYLLNRVDQEVRAQFSSRLLRDQIASRLAQESEALFFTEGEEREFR